MPETVTERAIRTNEVETSTAVALLGTLLSWQLGTLRRCVIFKFTKYTGSGRKS